MKTFGLALGLFAVAVWPARAVIDAGLQPRDLVRVYQNVAAAEVTAVDVKRGTLGLKLGPVHKGGWKAGTVVTLQASDEMKEELARRAKGGLAVGQPAAVLAGKGRGSRANDFLVYADNVFFSGSMQGEGPWEWRGADAQTEGRDLGTMRGTFCGETEQFLKLLAEMEADTDHFPRRAYVRFEPDRVLDTLPAGTTGGVAVADFDGNGLPDLFVTSSEGDRIYMQVGPMRFANATGPLGLTTRSRSVAVADFGGDGIPDLVLDGVLVQVVREGRRVRFAGTTWLPTFTEPVLGVAVLDLDADGRPDVVVSLEGGGLRAFRNGGGSEFVEVTKEVGLDQAEAGQGGTGQVTAGYLAGQPALFYGSDPGFVLRLESGKFKRVPLGEALSFVHGATGRKAGAGGAAFFPILDGADDGLLVATDSEFLLYRYRAGKMENVTRHGGEITEGSFQHAGVVVGDFDVDGRLDFYGVARGENGQNRLILNRGYGKFMWAEMNKAYDNVFQGPAHERGGSGAVAVDVDGDGAPDLVLVNDSGHVVLLRNATLGARVPEEHPTHDLKRLGAMRRILVEGGPSVGEMELRDGAGKVLTRRDVRLGALPGSSGEGGQVLVVPGAGRYTVVVHGSDGKQREYAVDVTKEPEAKVRLEGR